MGPAIVSPKLIPDPQKLQIFTKVCTSFSAMSRVSGFEVNINSFNTKLNGDTVQDSSTADMIFSVAKTIAFLSQGTTLLPGDILFTGT